MRKLYSSIFVRFSLFVILTVYSVMTVHAQTTITTLPNPPYSGGGSLAGPSNISFLLNNTNPFAINLTGLSNWCTVVDNGSVWQLYYSATSLSGTSTDVTAAPWTLIATSSATTVAAPGITPLNFTGLSFTIPATTQYRFVLRNTGPGNTRYSLAAAPNTFTDGGVTLATGNFQIAGLNVGYAGAGVALGSTPRYFTGAVTFAPFGPCTNPPVPGTVSSTASSACLNVPFTLSSTGGTGGTGQTYQWQISTDNVNFTDIPGETSPTLTTSQTTTHYYRLVVTCGVSVNSNSVQVNTAAGVSGTYTINSALPTGGTNFQTFNAAYDFIKCGINGPVVFNVDAASGPYNEQLIMSPVPGASAANTVTFNGNGRTISFLSSNTNERAVIKLNGADHIKFNNLVITALGTLDNEYGFAVQMLNDADSNSVTNCTINVNTSSIQTNYAGIVLNSSATSATTAGVSSCDGNLLSGNTITGGHYGITIVGSPTQSNGNNIIRNNQILDFYSYGIYLLGNFNTLVDSNRISRPLRSPVTIFYGVYVTGLNILLNITRNTISNPCGGDPLSTSAVNGIYFTGVDALAGLENKVTNNLMYDFTGNGDINAIHNVGSDNVWYLHNTISLDGTGGTGISRVFYQTTLAAGVRFENNLVSITRAGTSTKYALYFNTAASDIVSDRNNLYLNSPTGNTFTGFLGSPIQTLLSWQTATINDANSRASNPVFTDVFAGNYKPLNASIDNMCIPVGVNVDILGAVRSATTPDVGAYEYTPQPCAVPATPGTPTFSANPVCQNTAIQLMLTGNSNGLNQTYQWQTSLNVGGPFVDLGNLLSNPDTIIVTTVTQYFRVVVSCGGNSVASIPVLLFINPALPEGTYTINSAGPAPNNFVSFNAAKAAMACGIAGPVIFNVVAGSGPYNEQLILDTIPGTSALNTVTFNGNGNTISFSSSNTDERAVIKLRSTDHIIFNNLVIDAANGAGTFGYGIQLIDDADSNKVNNCTILANTSATTTNFAGIVMNAADNAAITTGNTLCDGNIFSNNTITGGYYGITMVGSNTVPVNQNTITGNTISDFYTYGVYLGGNDAALVESNNISRPTRTTIGIFNGIYVNAVNTNLQISKNRIHNANTGNTGITSASYGIYFNGVDATGGQENIVSNNLIYNFDGTAVQYGLYNNGSNSVFYYHNTVALADAEVTSALTYGFYQTTDASGIELRNNIFSITRAGNANKFALFYNTPSSTILSNTNDFFVQGTNAFVGYNGANRATLANWITATGQDVISVDADPLFLSPPTGNFTPFSIIMNDRGAPLGITTDILNNSRSATTPDMGAYEFAVPPCTAPPVAGNALANPSSGICVGTPIALTLAGNSFGSGQTFQWEFSTNIGGPWSPLGGPRLLADTIILASSTLYYRAAITCGGNTDFSIPVLVTLNPAFLAGDYTINKNLPASATNFTSFTTAVAALECGITGAVNFYVSGDTYTEQVRIHAIGGTSATSRVSFIGDPANTLPAVLTYDATNPNLNYVLKLDSASYITYSDITITAINATNGRAVEVANTASFDSIVNCTINVPVVTATGTTVVGIYSNLLKGKFNVIKGNAINNGATGIYWSGLSATNLSYDHMIDSNIVNNTFNYGIYISFNGRIQVSNNTVNLGVGGNTNSYGIYSINSDSAFRYTGNMVNMNGTNSTVYGMYFSGCDGRTGLRGRVANNTIMATTGNLGNLYGLYQTASSYTTFVNNVISINTSGITSYGSYSTAGGGNRYWNNSIVSTASSTNNNVAAYFAQTSGALPSVQIQNNIFSHLGSGRAMYVTNPNFINSDYNTFYTNGPVLIQWNNANQYANLQRWRDTSFWDMSSIAIQPALLSSTDLRPDLANPDVWAIHGRGVQNADNDMDFNGDPRPTTLTTGVPDMGAYEFFPTALPTVLTAIPALPAPGITQTFMYGTDTVTKITYSPTAPVPASISLRRYSGVIPPGLAPGQQSMYYYTAIDVPAQGAYDYDVQQFFVDSWQGFIPTKPEIKLGRTDASNAWLVNANSTVDTYQNFYADTNLVYIDKFTGLTDGTVPPPPVVTYPVDSSNKGTRFWVAYGHHWDFGNNNMDMVLYLSTEAAATVQVKINGTNYVKTYQIPANSVRVSLVIPKSGLFDARITDEGLFDRGIRITSDVPIVAYAHIYYSTNSGACMLLPTGVYGYEYQSLNARQSYSQGTVGAYSWFYAIADHDSTLVEITPAVATKGGRPAGVPFQVYLNTGQVYNVMAAVGGLNGTDLSGSTIKSIANASGNCYPIAVFSGSSRTSICPNGSGDNLIQQVFPSQAWGKRYLSFATARSNSNTTYNINIFRVMVKDPATIVKNNGVVLTGLVVPGNYYEFSTTGGSGTTNSVYIESNKPVMVAQYMVSTSCHGSGNGVGDPEMIYISPIEQGIKKAVFYSTNKSAITSNYINVVISNGGLASLTIDGINTFTDVFPHPSLPGYTCIRHNLGGAASQHIIESDSAFTAITYGLGSVESYGYNAGTLVKNLNGIGFITNVLGSGSANSYTCTNAPFQFSVIIPIKPTKLEWLLSGIGTLSPNADVIQLNPTPVDSILNNDGSFNYIYTITTNYTFSTAGVYNIPIRIYSPELEGCNSRLETTLSVTVIAGPVADFTTVFSGCFGSPIQFNGIGTTSNGVPINTWNWDFGDVTTANIQNPVKNYAAPGTYNVNLSIVAQDGCVADTIKTITINPISVVDVVTDSLSVCSDSTATFSVQNPQPGTDYNWYSVATGGTIIFTGPVFTTPVVTSTVEYFVESISSGTCVSARKRVTATVLGSLPNPVASVDSVYSDRIRFKWNAVPGASAYKVSTDGGNTWIDPSSGPTGLTHTVTGLLPLTDATIIVRALGVIECQQSNSAPVTGKTLGDAIFIPNSFTPNGDGKNDVLLVYGNIIRDMKMSVFNQWGQKIFETSNQLIGWNGTHSGKIQPSGVYMYVMQATLRDGTTVTRKGSVNLIR